MFFLEWAAVGYKYANKDYWSRFIVIYRGVGYYHATLSFILNEIDFFIIGAQLQ